MWWACMVTTTCVDGFPAGYSTLLQHPLPLMLGKIWSIYYVILLCSVRVQRKRRGQTKMKHWRWGCDYPILTGSGTLDRGKQFDFGWEWNIKIVIIGSSIQGPLQGWAALAVWLNPILFHFQSSKKNFSQSSSSKGSSSDLPRSEKYRDQ